MLYGPMNAQVKDFFRATPLKRTGRHLGLWGAGAAVHRERPRFVAPACVLSRGRRTIVINNWAPTSTAHFSDKCLTLANTHARTQTAAARTRACIKGHARTHSHTSPDRQRYCITGIALGIPSWERRCRSDGGLRNLKLGGANE